VARLLSDLCQQNVSKKAKNVGLRYQIFGKKLPKAVQKMKEEEEMIKKHRSAIGVLFEIKEKRVMGHVSLLDLCKTPFCKRRRPY
jgi:predicted metal-binding protein